MGPLEQAGALDQEPMGLIWRPWGPLRLDGAPDQEPMGRFWRLRCPSGDHGALFETTGPPGASWGLRLKTNGSLERPEAQLKSKWAPMETTEALGAIYGPRSGAGVAP